MISIIICSRNPSIPQELKNSIEETIGCQFETIIIDNSTGQHSIFQAYNEGVRKAHGELLCFCHDDIVFKSYYWGQRVVSYFETMDNLGILGVAGAHFLPSSPMYWSSSPFISEHNLNNDNGVLEEFFHEDFFQDATSIEVVAVDGLCFFMPKALFGRVWFDEKSYQGFHLYDMDICFQVIKEGMNVKVCRDILIEHFWSEKETGGSKSLTTLDKNLSIFCEKWKHMLPIVRGISIPDHSINQINKLCYFANDAIVARNSRAYRLGRFLLKPFKFLKK